MSDSYNYFERRIARFLSRYPFLKSYLKYTYSLISYFLNKKSYRCKTELMFYDVAPGLKGETFFGYYDKLPSMNGDVILVYNSLIPTCSKPRSDKSIDLVVYDVRAESVLDRFPVRCYNWQQGSRAQWLNDYTFTYNDIDEKGEKCVSIVRSTKDPSFKKEFCMPVQDSFRDQYFLSINYRRLRSLSPDYGYTSLPPMTYQEMSELDNDGVWLVDYETNEKRLVLTLKTLSDFALDYSVSKTALHTVNHVMISPAGDKFIFIHRYYYESKRMDRLFVCDISGERLRLICDYGLVSHCAWIDNDKFIGYLTGPNYKDGYWIFNLETNEFAQFGNRDIESYGDGHPSVANEWFVTDSYPDKARMQKLLLCNWRTGEMFEVGEFFHGFRFWGSSRCDLHPRISPDGDCIYFDSVMTGRRRLYRMNNRYSQ